MVAKKSKSPFSGYLPPHSRGRWPFAEYAALMGIYSGAVGALLYLSRPRSRGGRAPLQVPKRYPLGDLALLSVATHKISLLLSKDLITSPIRAPFLRFRRFEGRGEVSESVRGSGMSQVIGEMLNCPYCLQVWVSTGLQGLYLLSPRSARLIGVIFTAATVSTFLHVAYEVADDIEELERRNAHHAAS